MARAGWKLHKQQLRCAPDRAVSLQDMGKTRRETLMDSRMAKASVLVWKRGAGMMGCKVLSHIPGDLLICNGNSC